MRHIRIWLLLSSIAGSLSCTSTDTERDLETLPPASAEAPLTTIAFGSCNMQHRKQPLWQEILKNQPQLWIWLGDNIYANTNDMAVMKAEYEKQLNHPEYLPFRQHVPVVGTWDDHDYGQDNVGKEYAFKDQSAQLFWDFVGEPVKSKRRQQKGIYSAHTYGPKGRQVKLILLDVRYFRDSLPGPEPNFTPNLTGDILGPTQWKWLERELKNSKAQFHLIGSGSQIIANDHGFERWGNFPNSRKRLFDLIAQTKAANVIFLSGDRHFAEVSRLTWPGIAYPLYDFTSSGLTHNWKGGLVHEPNQYRMGKMHDKLNFGLLRFHWRPETVLVEFQIRGRNNKLHQNLKIEYALPPRAGRAGKKTKVAGKME
ncbi:MAG: alkaline phosphatase D family protein [Rufibacter sp.]